MVYRTIGISAYKYQVIIFLLSYFYFTYVSNFILILKGTQTLRLPSAPKSAILAPISSQHSRIAPDTQIMPKRNTIVTHHAPDLDAVGAVWMLKRFDPQNYADARIAFVNPGKRLSLDEANKLGIELHEATHVDTGLGRFDHHQPDRGLLKISATSLTYEYVCSINPSLAENGSLQDLASFITDIDHFGEIHWPESDNLRYSFMIHELIHGFELQANFDDDSQMHFGLTCLDCAYAVLRHHRRAEEILNEKAQNFKVSFGEAVAISTRNDDVIKIAQKHGSMLVIRKDPSLGNIRIKARPDADVDLQDLYQKILNIDKIGNWYYHPSGKMLINGSVKHKDQKASPLTLQEVVNLVKEIYG